MMGYFKSYRVLVVFDAAFYHGFCPRNPVNIKIIRVFYAVKESIVSYLSICDCNLEKLANTLIASVLFPVADRGVRNSRLI